MLIQTPEGAWINPEHVTLVTIGEHHTQINVHGGVSVLTTMPKDTCAAWINNAEASHWADKAQTWRDILSTRPKPDRD